MSVKSKSGRMIEMPTDEEDKVINQGIANDSETYELSKKEFKQLRPVGRPVADVIKDRITIRLSKDVTDYFRATGRGWQTRIDSALKEYISQH